MEINESLLKFYKIPAINKNEIAFNFLKTIIRKMDISYRNYLPYDRSILDLRNIEEVWNNKLTTELKNEIIESCKIEEEWINDLFEIMNIVCKLDYDPEEMEQHHKKYNI